MYAIFICCIVLWLQTSNCVHQSCEIGLRTWTYNTTLEAEWTCLFENTTLVDESENVFSKYSYPDSKNSSIILGEDEYPTSNHITHELLMTKSVKDSDVKVVRYSSGNSVKFIPSSLFVLFPKLERLFFNTDQGLEIIQPESLSKAANLKVFYVFNNNVKILEKHLFLGSPLLEHINLEMNQIETIHRETFYKLDSLKLLFLHGNKIMNLNPVTFMNNENLSVLDLTINACINKKFIDVREKITVVEEIIKKCNFTLSVKVLLSLTDQVDKLSKIIKDVVT